VEFYDLATKITLVKHPTRYVVCKYLWSDPHWTLMLFERNRVAPVIRVTEWRAIADELGQIT
jgi:hypothetical protein